MVVQKVCSSDVQKVYNLAGRKGYWKAVQTGLNLGTEWVICLAGPLADKSGYKSADDLG